MQAKDGSNVIPMNRGANALRYPDAADYLCISRRTLEGMVSRGEIAVQRYGRAVRFEIAELERVKRRHTERAAG